MVGRDSGIYHDLHPVFLASYLIYDKEAKVQKKWIISLACVNIVLLAVLIPLGII